MSSPVDVAVFAAEAAAAALIDATEQLCRLDSVAGDGDHGFAMRTAAQAVVAGLREQPPQDVATLLERAGERFADAGGSMGALLSVVLGDLGAQAADTALDARRVGALLDVVAAAIRDTGNAEVGDKTILDAVAAAQTAANEAATNGADAVTALDSAATGARAGAAATADLIARIGRASRLGERSRGHVDPGAQSFAIVLTALAASYASTRPAPGAIS